MAILLLRLEIMEDFSQLEKTVSYNTFCTSEEQHFFGVNKRPVPEA
jgi:hypothetical protein